MKIVTAGELRSHGAPISRIDEHVAHARFAELWRLVQREELRAAMAGAADRCQRVALELVR